MPTPDGHIGSRDLCTGAVVERTIADGGVSSLKISATLQSDNWNGSQGWQIDRVTGSCNFQDATIRGTLNASDITTGYIDASVIDVRNLNASELKSGQISADRIATTSLNASNISSGTLSADYISGGTISADIISGGEISGYDVSITNLNANNIVAGVLDAQYIYATNLAAVADDTGDINLSGWMTATTGGYRTSAGSTRIELTAGSYNAIRFYLNGSLEGTIGFNLWSDMNIHGEDDLYVTANNTVRIQGSDVQVGTSGFNSMDTFYAYLNTAARFYVGGTNQFEVDTSGVEVFGRINTWDDGISYQGTNGDGSSNKIGFKWGSPYIYGRVDNAVGAVVGTVSDPRLKADPQPLTGALDRLLALTPIDFYPKEFDGTVNRAMRHAGLDASQVKELEPWLVVGDDYLSVNYTGLVSMLVGAIQELAERVTALEAA